MTELNLFNFRFTPELNLFKNWTNNEFKVDGWDRFVQKVIFSVRDWPEF